MASLLAMHVVALAAPADTDSLAGDARLAAKRTFRLFDAPVRDLLADLNQQSGVDLFADASVADDRVTLISHDRPVSEAMRALATFFHYEWQREGTGAKSRYTLRLTNEARAEQQTTRQARLTELADATLREAKLFDDYAALPELERDRLIEELPQKLAKETDPAKAAEIQLQMGLLQQVADGSNRRLWVPVIYKLLRTLPRDQIVEMLSAGSTQFVFPKLAGMPFFPDSIIEELQKSGRTEIGIPYQDRGILRSVRLRLSLQAGKQWAVKWYLLIAQGNSRYSSATRYSGVVPAAFGMFLESAPAAAGVGPADWKSDAALSAPVSVSLASPVEEMRPGLPGQTQVNRLAGVFRLLDEAKPIDLVADGFWSTRLAGVQAKEVPVAEVLDRVARLTSHRWWKQDGFVMVQTRDLVADREAEPPATQVARWADQADRGLFTLDEMAELAALPDAQGSTIQEMNVFGVFPVNYAPLQPTRVHLQLWGALDRDKRRKAQGDGLPYKTLTADQQRLFALAATDPTVQRLYQSLDGMTNLAAARLKITMEDTTWWGVRRPGAASTWHVPRGGDPDNGSTTREEALRRFRQLDAGIKLGEVVAMTQSTVTFLYESEQGVFSRTSFTLPPRWGDG